MPNIEQRPYTLSWKPNRRKVTKVTPDVLVYVNGDTAIPGCPRCNGKINLQRFVKNVSIEAGVDPGAHSGTVQLAVPKVFGARIFREGKLLLNPGLEVHVYMRGHFPVKGQFAHLQNQADLEGVNLENYATYPYYHVFHGVVTSVSYDYADGFYNASMTLASLLHFWQYHNMAMNGSVIGSRPENSKVNPSLWGNSLSNMHPYSIIYTLYRDVAGAAGGVEFTLGDSSNIDAYSEVTGQQLYKMTQLYWEERFKTTIQNLRMYGVNGTLFNSVQQAFLGMRNHSSGDFLRKLLDHKHLQGKQSHANDIFGRALPVAKRLGLAGDGLDIVYSDRTSGDSSDSLSFNAASVYAFTRSPADAGSISNFETTYQTKLTIAQQVTEALGYEFFQDVDGDLVFKPPFYNLDTSKSRVYRIEDEDIISFSVQEKEPAATYYTVKAGQIAHWTNTGTEGFVGNRGQYIDYRLVAKFGWRPASQDVTYMTSPKSLQFLAQARLDILNIDTNSASLTIPQRAELKPGFPVYIVSEDTYYYVTQFSHSHTFGGMCTTTLTLTGRRTKFFAPGIPGAVPEGENGIERVKLDRPDYPERPLQVYENGQARWAGFPNVVMALDPMRANPKFFMMGSGLENLNVDFNNIQLFINLVREQVKQVSNGAGIFGISPTASQEERETPTQNTTYVLKQSDNPEDDIQFTINDLLTEFRTIAQAQDEVRRLGTQISVTYRQQVSQRLLPDDLDRVLKPLNQRLEQVRAVASGQNPDGGLFRVVSLIRALQGTDVVRREVPGLFESAGTASYLDLLGDLKASFAPGDKTPGYYRYYSASHPDPEMQGQAVLTWDAGSEVDVTPFQTEAAPVELPQASDPVPVPKPGVESEFTQFGGFTAEEKNPDLQLAKLDQKLQQVGVVDFDSSQLAQVTTRGKRARNATWRRVPGEPIPNEVVDNLANMGFILQLLKNELPSGVDVRVANGWRPGDRQGKLKKNQDAVNANQAILDDPLATAEEKAAARKTRDRAERTKNQVAAGRSKHWNGLAVDIDIRPNTAEAVDAVRFAVSKLAIEGKIKGFGTYRSRTRIHIDLRDVSNTACPFTYHSAGGFNSGANNQTQQIVNEAADRLGVERVGKGQPGRCAEFNAYPFPITYGPELLRILGLKGRPPKKVKEPETPPPPIVRPEPNPPKITITPQKLEQPIEVDGFVRGPLPLPEPGTRAPEAMLGVVKVERGIKIAQPNSSEARVVPTSDIQATAFAEFSLLKSVGVAGLANEQGMFLPEELKKFLLAGLLERFQTEVGGLADDPSKTPNQLLGDLYTQMGEDISQRANPEEDSTSMAFPVYQEQSLEQASAQTRFTVQEYRVVSLPSFADAVKTKEALRGGGSTSAASLSLFELQMKKPFTGKTLGATVSKVFTAYATVIANAVTEEFTVARASAGYQEGAKPFGFNSRMVQIQDAFGEIAFALTGRQFDPAKRASEDRAVRAAKTRKGVLTPVFPVSDASGYEVIGSFRYGRGLSIETGGTFERINTSPDPFVGVSAAAAEAYLTALTSVVSRKSKSSIQDRVDLVRQQILEAEAFSQEIGEESILDLPPDIQNKRLDRLSEIRVALALAQESNPDAIAELVEVNGDADALRIDHPNPSLLETRLANFPANALKEGVLKTTVVNAAYNLVDLSAHLDSQVGQSCACQTVDSSLLLEAYSRKSFLTLEGIDPVADPVGAGESEDILLGMPDYQAQQKALRGATLDTRNNSVSDAFSKLKGDLARTASGVRSGVGTVRRAFSDVNLGGNDG